MRVPRFHAPRQALAPGAQVALAGEEAHHLVRVLRLRAGDAVELFDGAGAACRGRVVEAGRREAVIALEERVDRPPPLAFELTCAVCPPKGKRAQRLVEELSELGVSGLAPLVLERSQNRLPSTEQIERWALEAAKQCQRDRLLEALPPLDLAGLVAAAGAHDLALLADPHQAPPLREALPAAPPARVLLAIGPEGGFTPGELERLRAAGLHPVRLGRTVLRIETAAAALVAALVAAWC